MAEPVGAGRAPSGTGLAAGLRTPLGLWLPVVAHMALIFVLSSLSRLPAPPGGLSDKEAHAIAYGVLGGLLYRALAGGTPAGLTARHGLLAVLGAALYGVSDEFHQSFVPGRTADLFDLLADVSGAALVAVTAWTCAIIWQFRRGRDALRTS